MRDVEDPPPALNAAQLLELWREAERATVTATRMVEAAERAAAAAERAADAAERTALAALQVADLAKSSADTANESATDARSAAGEATLAVTDRVAKQAQSGAAETAARESYQDQIDRVSKRPDA